MKKTDPLFPLSEMHYTHVDIKPANFNFGEGYPEKWEHHSASRCEKCNAVLIGWNGEKHSDLDDDSTCDGYVPENEGPMMNYLYPLNNLRQEIQEAATLIVDLPLCIVEMEDGDLGLALTGGGMNLSWEICEAFMRLGFIPPHHFADLPQMAGRGESEKDRWIIDGCKLACDAMSHRANRTHHNLKQFNKKG